MKISAKDVEHVALLGRLELSAEEKKKYTDQLNDILEYAEKLKELDTENVPPTAHALSINNVFREDIARPGLDVEKALQNAPSREGEFYKVPKIV